MDQDQEGQVRRAFYRLEGREPVPCSPEEWSARPWPVQRVAFDVVGQSVVSTIFIGVDFSFFDEPPAIFETAVRTEAGADVIRRYATWAEAEAGHARAVEEAARRQPPGGAR